MENSEKRAASPPALLRLSPDDNVLVATRPLEAGAEVPIEGVNRRLDAAAGFGHKLAARPIATGEKILKCGFPIGSATRDIAPGELVHLHNMQSDYLPTSVRSDMEEPAR